MKNQWPFWLFVIAIVVVVVISMNYHGKDDVVSLGDIFPEQQGAFEYEYISKAEEQVEVVEPVEAEPVVMPKAPVGKKVVEPEPVKPAVVVKKEQPPVVKVSTTKGAYTIQILSSKDQGAIGKELKKAKDQGFDSAFIKKADLGAKGVWYRIYIGQFSSMSQARESLVKVKEKYTGAFITKL